jgi:hypothetical protein
MKNTNPLGSLEKLSRFVYKLNYTDKTSEDYVYYQIIKYLAEYGSFKITELDKKFNIEKQVNGKTKKIQIERRKLKNILYGFDKDFIGLIPLGYVIAIPEWKNRGGNQEYVYYLTEKGILASFGLFSYKKNINLNKILQQYKRLGRHYNKFINEFIKLQIQVCLSYYYVQGLSLAFKKEHPSEYDKLRADVIKPFEIKIDDEKLENQFRYLLNQFNKYRKIHLRLYKEIDFLHLLWEESDYVIRGIFPSHGFHGWYRLDFLTSLDKNLAQIQYKSVVKTRSTSQKLGIPRVKSEYLYSLFQDDVNDISDNSITGTMKNLGLFRKKKRNL